MSTASIIAIIVGMDDRRSESNDRTGPEWREMFGDSVNSPLPQDLSVLIGAERMGRPSAN